jgi:hypothetical protein
MAMTPRVLLVLVFATGIASADRDDGDEREDDDRSEPRASVDENQFVLINATSRLGDVGPVKRLRRVLGKQGLVVSLPDSLEAILDGSSAQIDDLDAIREAYNDGDYDRALELIEENQSRILGAVAGGDPLPALSVLCQWRAMLAYDEEKRSSAVGWFRAATRFNPAWSLEDALAAPKVERLVRKARKEVDETGRLRVDADVEGAMMEIDGGEARSADDKIELPIGHHVVVVRAGGFRPHAELVEIEEDRTAKIEVILDYETTDDKIARTVDRTVAAPPGKGRSKRLRYLSKNLRKYVPVTKYLVLEEVVDDRVKLRVYDTATKRVSKALELENSASSAAITRKVMAALDPDTMVDANTVMLLQRDRDQRWYERWYVWVGVGAVIGGGALGYHYMTREPTTIRGF